ncbi:hypothetical protein IAD21_02870 [Abditibacteriota bacterium]|nr:hypothetical protein IAD21_02870 [Abditibacteriota bacterium]
MTTRQLHPADALLAQSVVSQFHERGVSVSYSEKFLANPANYLLIAEENGEVIGFLSAHQLDSIERESAAMFIYEIEVEKAHHRKGAGRALIDHIRTIALERGMFEMFVFTNRSNTSACAFYQSTGGQIEEGDELMFVYYLPDAQRQPEK